ncbi:hypothetical protein AK812_SmicGene28683 [Symbiodinium microadriaticum]|uniref:Uncharacterized protein n=1 Tax=Symbiodinium microadriaticum TaxID=2951 RepID=A0A1Q9D3V5_SYMMI|nr:hypothetical protein AK812_SmicGene28683 [Symbiodinium microadriaticum]
MGNSFISCLYKNGVWIRKTPARAVAEMGYGFLQGYMKLARMCFNAGVRRFVILPKMHMIAHTVFWMFDQADIRDSNLCIRALGLLSAIRSELNGDDFEAEKMRKEGQATLT